MAPKTIGVHQLKLTRSADQIRSALKILVNTYEGKIEKLIAEAETEAVSFEARFGKLAEADGYAALASTELTLPALVSSDADARAASSAAKKDLNQMWSRAYTRTDLYKILQDAQHCAATSEEKRLVDLVLEKFRQSGAALASAEREKLASLDNRCKQLALQAEQNINEDCSSVDLTPQELAGCEESFIESLPGAGGLKRCALKAPVLLPIMQRAHSSETRRRVMEANQQRLMDKNGPLLEELLTLRQAAAVCLGFSCHADRMISTKMAGKPATAREFCEDVLKRLQPLRDAELVKLSKRKQSHQQLSHDTSNDKKRKSDALEGCEQHGVNAWDVSYYADLLKREELQLDDEKVKEFFPLEGTVRRCLEVYSELLGLTFERSSTLPVWHEEVVAFEVKDGSKLVGHLFLDQFPRDGKFSHQMILPLAPAFTSRSGEECVPACVNISNFPRPEGGKPALLRFAEMKTLFHELGHVMHCLCTQSRFSLLSWAWPMVPWPGGVEQDFLEVPSMALEKFACEPALLERVAQHFSGKKTPELGGSTIRQLQMLEKWMTGTQESRSFAMFLFDLILHSQAPPYSFDGNDGLSVAELNHRVLEKYTTLKQLPGTNSSASWYHIFIGYDAGYYGYGWSDVFAADIFEAMRDSEEGPLSAATGQRLRAEILGPCATKAGSDMLRAFLGREPSLDAWCRMKGIP